MFPMLTLIMFHIFTYRYVVDDGSDDYKIIMLTKRCLNFRVIKVR